MRNVYGLQKKKRKKKVPPRILGAVEGKNQDSSLQKGVSPTYTLRLSQNRNFILYKNYKKKKTKQKKGKFMYAYLVRTKFGQKISCNLKLQFSLKKLT